MVRKPIFGCRSCEYYPISAFVVETGQTANGVIINDEGSRVAYRAKTSTNAFSFCHPSLRDVWSCRLRHMCPSGDHFGFTSLIFHCWLFLALVAKYSFHLSGNLAATQRFVSKASNVSTGERRGCLHSPSRVSKLRALPLPPFVRNIVMLPQCLFATECASS